MEGNNQPQLDPNLWNQIGTRSTIFGNLFPQLPLVPIPKPTSTPLSTEIVSPTPNPLSELLASQSKSSPFDLLGSNSLLQLSKLLNTSTPMFPITQSLVPLGKSILPLPFAPNRELSNVPIESPKQTDIETLVKTHSPARKTFKYSFSPYPSQEERSESPSKNSKPSTQFRDYFKPKNPGRPLTEWEKETYRQARIPMAPQPQVEVIPGIPPLNSINHHIAIGNFEKWNMKIPETQEWGKVKEVKGKDSGEVQDVSGEPPSAEKEDGGNK